MSDEVQPCGDEDDWFEVEKTTACGKALAPVAVKLGFRGKPGQSKRATASFSFRFEAAGWIDDHGPRFRIQIGGPNCNNVRVIADAAGGKFEAHEIKGVQRMSVGHINAWPNEARDATEAKWAITSPGVMMLTLPEGFASATKPAPDPPAQRIAEPAKAEPFPITTRDAGLSAAVRSIKPERAPDGGRSHSFGDPPPGRSALDRRRAGKTGDET